METSTEKRSTGLHRGGGNGRRKLPMKKIDIERSLMVSFSKCRKGLFEKAADLSTLFGARVAAIAFFPAGKPFTFGNVDSLLLHHGLGLDRQPHPMEEDNEIGPSLSSSEQEVVDNVANETASRGGGLRGLGFVGWWLDVAVDGMGLKELQSMLDEMVMFEKLLERAEDGAWADSCLNE